MIRKIITNIEGYIGQVLSLNSAAILGSGVIGNVFITYNDDGTLKVNEKNEVEIVGAYPESLLFRGQSGNFKLIPKIARKVPVHRLEQVEQNLISEIRRRGDSVIKKGNLDDWELLIYVQHYGLATRLLDWTTNPLVALWFACQGEEKDNAFVYVLRYSESDMVDLTKDEKPFKIESTKIFKPNLNNERIIAQNGWFTVHSNKGKENRIIPLEEEEVFQNNLWQMEIPAINKLEILEKLNILGVNHETIYPGIEGACQYINWINNIE